MRKLQRFEPLTGMPWINCMSHYDLEHANLLEENGRLKAELAQTQAELAQIQAILQIEKSTNLANLKGLFELLKKDPPSSSHFPSLPPA